MKIQTLEELRESLTEASRRSEEADAALQVADPTDEEHIAELEQRFDAELVEVRRLSSAVERKEKAAEAMRAVPRPDPAPAGDPAPVRIGNEPMTYDKRSAFSFFKDVLYASKEGDPRAQARLQRHTREMEVEGRAMTTGAGSGIGFVPPAYLQDEWAEFARAARPTADAIGSRPLPASGVSFNIPRVTTGSTTAVQASEGAAVNDSSPVTDDLTLTLTTVAGKVDMSRQAFDRSDPAMDDVIGADLAADLAQKVDIQVINGSGAAGQVEGLLQSDGTVAVTYTDATPTVAELWGKITDAVQQIASQRFMYPNLIVMHPRRWATFIGTLDSSGRPIVPFGTPQNALAQFRNVTPQGIVAEMQGLAVLVDPNIPTTLGAGTEDAILVMRTQDIVFFEDQTPTIRVYEEVLSGTLQVRVQAWQYIAFSAEKYPKALGIITGTGLIAPTF